MTYFARFDDGILQNALKVALRTSIFSRLKDLRTTKKIGFARK